MRSIVLIILLVLSFAADAQTREVIYPPKDTLLARRKQIMAAIEETERELQAIKSDKQATIGQLRALQSKLADRQRLIGNINDELGDIDRDIRNSSREVMTLKQKLEQLNTRYAQSLRYSYSTRSSYDMLAFLFSSRDFNEAMRRMKYLKKFRDFRKYQVQQITHTQVQLKQKIGVLSEEKTKKDQVLNAQVQQKQILQRETEQTNQVVQDLKSKESKLLADIEKNKKVNARINKAISDLIEREMAKAAKAAEAEAKKSGIDVKSAGKGNIKSNSGGGPDVAVNEVPRATTGRARAEVSLMLTPEDVELAENFEGNKGKMYWPVEKGYIIDHFGVHPHPLYPKVNIENSGVDIQTDENARVRCVFNGVVTSVFSVTGSSWIVMVRHGNYCTVYNSLASTSVRVGDEVKAKQVIGSVSKNDEGVPFVNFQIWKSSGKKDNVKLNPEQWLGKAR
ncbi:MAG: peptidoglycan DD-metalloendopeptidase family protein [Chitinophagaceae bacterium]|nr:peptidoglycan DD-metalloendopeptidase family protein [Chitinophagaceae bacterium]